MLFPSLLVFLTVTIAFADIESELETCIGFIDVEELENLDSDSLEPSEQLKVVCPMMINTFNCFEDILKTETGMTLENLADAAEGTEIGRGARLAANIRDIFVDLCTEGSDLNEAYLADAECLDKVETHIETCKEKADVAMEALSGFAENAVEAADDDEYKPDEDCAKAAYMSACVAALIHEDCGRRAFDTYNSVIKRSGVFKNILCSAEDLQHLKTTFVDKLDIDDDQKDILRLALDLKKRRK